MGSPGELSSCDDGDAEKISGEFLGLLKIQPQRNQGEASDPLPKLVELTLQGIYGHDNSIDSLAFSSDFRRIFTGRSDKTVKVWEGTSGREILTLKGLANAVQSVAISPDGRRIVAGISDGTAKVWEAASPEQVAAWRKREKEAERATPLMERLGLGDFIRDILNR